MSIESKYSIRLLPAISPGYYRLVLAGAGQILLGLFLLVMSSFWCAGLILSTVIFMMALCWPVGKPFKAVQWIVSESGQGRCIEDSSVLEQDNWQITARSRLLPFALFIVQHHAQHACYKYYWILPWQLSEENYRRLARIVFRQGLT